MRVLLLACALAQLLAVPHRTEDATAHQAGIITGRIETEHAGVRAPVRRARVTLSREAALGSSTTSTDGDGRYLFEGLASGRYVVSVEKAGFVTIASAPIDLTGTSRTADLLLTPGGASEGRLVDDRNVPVARLAVTADRLSETSTVAASYAGATDDLGRFRIHSLPAGRYRVRATPPAPASGDEYFYPGVIAASDALVIAITPGMTSDRLEFTVAAAPLSPIAAAVIEDTARAASNDTPDPKATRITGSITRSDSGESIANATAQLTDAYGVVRHRAKTGLDGRFDLVGVPAGTWALSAVATGFVSVDAFVTRPTGAGIRLIVKDGARIRQDVTLAPMSAIEGRVLDEFGDPAPGVVVQVAQKGAAVGLSRFVSSPSIVTTGATDDRGWFRAPGLFPGDYYLIAVPRPFENSSMTRFAPTFFPGATTSDAATPISVVAGRDVYDARFALAPARIETLTGQVVDASGRPVPKAQVLLMPVEDGEVRTMVMARIAPEVDGTFTFDDVPEGTYVLQTMAAGMFGVTTLTVDASDREPRKVVAKPLTTARGRVVFEGDAPTPAPDPRVGPTITVQPTSFTTGPVGSNLISLVLQSDWRFEIPNLAWFGVLRVTPPTGWTLARVRHEGRDITDTPFDFQSGDVAGLEVVLTNRVGTVSGTVTSGGQPAARVRILIFGAAETRWTYLTRTMTNSTTDDSGAFSVGGLVPGRYLAVSVAADMRLSDHASLLNMVARGVPFTVSERTNTVVNLTLIK